jgi:acetoin utilization deacetylase AcuC-like enzyme
MVAVMLAMPVVWDERCRLHDPAGEVFVGVRTPGTEVRERVDAIIAAVGDATLVPAERHDDDVLLAVHDAALVDFLATAWESWESSRLVHDPGQDRVVPYVFAHDRLTAGRVHHVPTAVWARTGYFAYDTMTLIGPGTWEAVRGAVDVALTAADLVVSGAPHAYACCRPPGHHACRSCFGGSCYLNNSAVAAEALAQRGSRVAVLDVDAHHGNGTQDVFWERGDVLVASVHVDPGAGWFPHFLGFAGETGGGAGEGANLNVTVAPGSGDREWLEAVTRVAQWAREQRAEAVVVPLGVDAAAGDPESPLRVTPDGFREAGRILGSLRLPTVLVQEGGYDLARLGPLVLETLRSVENAASVPGARPVYDRNP